MFGRATVCVLAAATILGVAEGAAAHSSPAVESWISAPVEQAPLPTSSLTSGGAAIPESPGSLWPVLLLASLAPALWRRRARKLVAALLVGLVGVLAVETALHSVHHGLADGRVACATASVATHVHGATAGLLAIDAPSLRSWLAPAAPEPLVRPLRPVDSQHDRAPPSASA